jgi:hypothetical protein
MSCSNSTDHNNEPEAVVSITNHTLEKLKIDSDEYFLFKKVYHYIDPDETRRVWVKTGEWITVVGDVSGKNYGSRIFPFEGSYTWIIV